MRRYNSDIDPQSDSFKAAVLLLAAVDYGQNIDILARRTGVERSFVAKCARRLIDNGVWVSGQMVTEWSPEDEASGSFWNDVAVAEGKLCRRTDPRGQIEWAPAGYWKKSYEFVDTANAQSLSTVYRDPAVAGAPDVEAEEGAAEVVAEAGAEVGIDAEGTGAPSTVDRVPAPESQAPPLPTNAPTFPANSELDAEGGPSKELFPDAVWLR